MYPTSKHGNLFITSAPSGAGKTSLLAALLEKMQGVCLSISHTTRPIRPGEKDGVNYHFTDRDAFIKQVKAGRFLEHAEVFDNLYGTSADWVDEQRQQGKDVILEIDWQGAQQVRRLAPEAIGVFILPPSIDELERRLRSRGQDSDTVIQQRIAGAQAEIAHYNEYDYLVVNDEFEASVNDLAAIIHANRLKSSAQQKTQLETLQNLLATP